MNVIKFYDECKNGHIENIQLMIEAGLVNDYDYSGAFYVACRNGHIEIIQLMIEKCKLKHSDYNSALYIACQNGNLEVIELMIEKGANHFNGGLYFGCRFGNIESVRLMIKKGANDYNIGLYDSYLNGNIEIVRLLIERGATEIHRWCSFPKNKDVIQTLLSSLSLKVFEKIGGYEELIKIIKKRENYVIRIMDEHLNFNINNYLLKEYIKNDF